MLLLNEATSRADMGTAIRQYERAWDALEQIEAADPVDIRAVLAGTRDQDNVGHDFERMWVSAPMREFFEALQDDFEASSDLFRILSKRADESPVIKHRLDRLVTDLEREL